MDKRMLDITFYKDITGHDYGIAHLFEHLIVQSFYYDQEKNGSVSGLWGWFGGNTFSGTMFLTAGFYDKEVQKKFLSFINQPININQDIVINEIRRMEAEDDVIIDYHFPTVIEALKNINDGKFIQLNGNNEFYKQIRSSEKVLPKSKILHIKRSRKEFQNFCVKVGIKNPTKIDKTVFMRLFIPAMESVSLVLCREAAYGYFDDGPIFDDKKPFYIYRYAEFTIKKNTFNKKKLEDAIKERLNGVNLSRHKKQIKNFIRQYYQNINNPDFPVDYFRDTGIITSKYHIYKSFTPENVQKTWDKLEVKIEKIT